VKYVSALLSMATCYQYIESKSYSCR